MGHRRLAELQLLPDWNSEIIQVIFFIRKEILKLCLTLSTNTGLISSELLPDWNSEIIQFLF